MKILVADDNAKVRGEIVEKLIQQKHQVSSADNGLTALSLAQTTQFDCIITDYKMPFIDGLKLAQNLVDEMGYRNSQIILLTTDTSQPVNFKIKQLNIQSFAKPVTADKVIQSLSQTQSNAAA